MKDASALRESVGHEKGLNSSSLQNFEPPVITRQPTWESVLGNAEKSEEYRKVSFSILYYGICIFRIMQYRICIFCIMYSVFCIMYYVF